MTLLTISDPLRLGDYAIFSDESCIAGHRYMIVGGVSCAVREAQRIHERVMAIRARSPFPMDSLQWKNITDRKVEDYRALVDLFCDLNSSHVLDFTCLVIDTSRLDHTTHNEGSGEAFFQKMIFAMVRAKVVIYDSPPALRCFHGIRSSEFALDDVRNIINSGIAKRKGRPLYRPLRQLEYMQVQDCGLHQINDVLLGCVAYHWNQKMRRNRGGAKSLVAKYAQSECASDSLGAPSRWTQRHFNVWQFRLRDPGA